MLSGNLLCCKEWSAVRSMQTPRYYYPTISLIIPTRNEAPNLRYVLPRIPAIVSEVILVDGNSNDNSVALAQQLLPDIRIIQQTGTGKGDAKRKCAQATNW